MASVAIRRTPRWEGARDLGASTLCGIGVAAVTAAITPLLIGHSAVTSVGALIVIAGSLWCLTTRRITLALALLMLYLGVLDGYLKLASGSTSMTFVRDALLYALAVGVLARASVQGRRFSTPPLAGWAIAFVIIVVAQIANPADGTIRHSLGGIRQNLEFVPLFFLAYAYVRTKRALRGFLVVLLVIASANGVANVIQFNESPQQLAAWGPGYRQRVLGLDQFGQGGRTFFTSTGQNLTRPFGLGSDSGSGGLMDAFALGGVLALISIPGTRRYAVVIVAAAALAIAGVITAQGRAVIVCAIAVLLAYVLLAATSRRTMTTVLAVVTVVGVAYLVGTAVIGSSSPASLRYSSLTPTDIISTVSTNRGSSLAAIPKYIMHYPLGAGLGVGGPAAGASGAPAGALVLTSETEFNYAIIDTGVPGMIALVAFTLAVVLIGFRRCKLEPDSEARLLLAAIIAPVAAMLILYWVSPISPTTPAGPYLWAVGGIVSYWLVDRPAQLRRANTASAPRPATG